jgi:sterol desaturase/sphingolipid hydroxylase (fatty acid hydroxylase superfamily)
MTTPRQVLNVALGVAMAGTAAAVAPAALATLAIAGAAAASIEVLRPLHPRRRSRAALATDLTHAVGNRFLQLPATLAALTVLAPVATWLVPDPARSGLHALPWWGRTVIVLVLSDLANYLGHRAMHRVPALWRLHAVHHSSEQLDWLATARAHPLDQAFTVTTTALPAIALGALEAQPWLLTLLFLYYPFVSHANADLHLPEIERIIVTPRFHHWHHALGTRTGNFGGFLAVWDHLFGTAHAPSGFPERYGIGDTTLDDDYLGHVLSPLALTRSPGPRPAPQPAA